MSEQRRTPLYDRHVAAGAKFVEFGDWQMPVQYPTGILAEHLAVRRNAGLFDVSHMGRFVFEGPHEKMLAFLQHVLTNNAAALNVGQAQYTIIPNDSGGAIDDAYLYRFREDTYLLVVNAANTEKDRQHFQNCLPAYDDVRMIDRTDALVMLSLQGPTSRRILESLIKTSQLPEPRRNQLSVVTIDGTEVQLARTGYTGEPLCFELFIPADRGGDIWDMLVKNGATPVGLGARDTLRLEAGLPLYGHELGVDAKGKEIPIFACPLAKFAVSFSPLKGNFVGQAALKAQHDAYRKIVFGDFSDIDVLPQRIMPLTLTAKGVARGGAEVSRDGRLIGYITSGTMVPHWNSEGCGLASRPGEQNVLRPICLALLDSRLLVGDTVKVDVHGRLVPGVIVPYHLRSDAPPYAHAIVPDDTVAKPQAPQSSKSNKVSDLLQCTIENTTWRQKECINLIPSEMTQSPMVRLLSVMDPTFRYAEHRAVKAFADTEIFYYQGTDFVAEVERLLEAELCTYLGCQEAETRAVSGQMANTVVFGAMIDYINMADRKAPQRQIRKVFNNDIGKGGHLSAQPMGALKDYIAREPKTDAPAVVNFPVLPDNPYKIDIDATRQLLVNHRPELLILGKSMVLHPEPVAQMRAMIDELGLACVLLYDAAHVLGLLGPHFQQPFSEGADLVTGSTHKTFFGTQRGVVAGNFLPSDRRYELWEAVRRRTFPGAVSNHHLGTLLGLLMAAYEMNHFKNTYQPAVLANAKAFARALKDAGLDVAGDSTVGYTETHQVILNVGYGKGPETAQRLEANNIITNYQATPDEEGFSASGAIRMGTAEMTRFGMGPDDFTVVAQLIADVVCHDANVRKAARKLRSNFTELQYCFSDSKYDQELQKLHELL